MPAKVVSPNISKGEIEVNIAGDPYPVLVKANQLLKVREDIVAESTSAAIRKFSKRAKLLGIRGYQNMTEKELKRAVRREEDSFEDIAKPSSKKKAKSKPSSKPKAKTTKPAAKPSKKAKVKATNGTSKTTTKKKVSKEKAKVALKAGDPANPFRHGSNSWKMAEELLKGGKRSDMIKRLRKTMPLHPWSKDKETEPVKAYNKRLLLTAAAMERDHGFKIKSEGRGTSGTLKAIPPGAKKKKSSAKSASKPSSKKSAGQKKSGKASSKTTTSKAKKKAKR